MKKYTPISCQLYDQLELWSIQQQLVHVLLLNGQRKTGRITDIKSVDSIEYLFLDFKSKIRLDEIRSINDLDFSTSNYC